MTLVSVTLCLDSRSLLAEEAPSPPSLDAFKEGEALLSDDERWASPGFRLSLHGLYGELSAEDEARAALLRGIEVSAGGRLEPRWGLMGRLQYALASEGVEGVYFRASLAPQLHLSSWLSLELSLGLAGLIELAPGRADQQAQLQEQLVAPYDHPESDPALAQCVGFGPSEALRLNLRYVLGPLSALSASLFVAHHEVTCVQSLDRVEPDSALPIERRQRWEQLSWGLSAGVSWR